MPAFYVIYDGDEPIGTAKHEHDAFVWMSHIAEGRITTSNGAQLPKTRKLKPDPMEYSVGIGGTVVGMFMERSHAEMFRKALTQRK